MTGPRKPLAVFDPALADLLSKLSARETTPSLREALRRISRSVERADVLDTVSEMADYALGAREVSERPDLAQARFDLAASFLHLVSEYLQGETPLGDELAQTCTRLLGPSGFPR